MTNIDALKIDYDVNIDDLMAFNLTVIGRRIVLITLVVWCVSMVGTVSTFVGDGNFQGLISNTVLVSGLFVLPLALYYPYVAASTATSLILIIASLFLFDTEMPATSKFTGFLSIAQLIVVTGFSGILIRQLVKYIYSGKTDSLGAHTLTVSASGVREKTPLSDLNISFELVSKIVQDNDRIFIFLGSAKALVVPKRAFSSSAESDTFFSQTVGYKSAFDAAQKAA